MKYLVMFVLSMLLVCGCQVPDKPQPEPTVTEGTIVDGKLMNVFADNKEDYQRFIVTTGITNKDIVIILVDCSGSMDGSRLKQAKESLNIYLDRLPQEVHARLLTIYNSGIVKYPTDQTREQLKQSISSLVASGGTPLGHGLEELEAQASYYSPEVQHIVMLVLTDGLCDWNDSSNMDWAAQRIIRKGWYLDVIGYELSANHALSKYASRYRNASEATLTNILLEVE